VTNFFLTIRGKLTPKFFVVSTGAVEGVQPAGSSGETTVRLFGPGEFTGEVSMLSGRPALDARGFIKTGPDISRDELSAAKWPLARSPHLLETTRPGVIAVGDVRAGNIKRVASAVGEGSIAISFVHQTLQE
jgi:CRP-like cAMP-binding protein